MRILFVHSTDFPHTQGRTAWRFYMPTAACLASMGHTVGVCVPRKDEEVRWMPGVRPAHFHCWSELVYWVKDNIDLLVLWTDKSEERKVAAAARRLGVQVLFAELGFLRHYRAWHMDPDGCGPDSSLVHYQPQPGHRVSIPRAGEHLGVLLQMEHDYAFRASPFPDNAHFVAALRAAYPNEPVLVRRHPRDPQPCVLPPDTPVDHSATLEEFLGKCWGVVGLNTSALYQALEAGLPCAMLADGPGRFSGAFTTTPELPPRPGTPEHHEQRRWALGLLADLKKRQISMDMAVTPELLLNHPVLGPLLEGQNGHLVREPAGVRSVVACGR